MKPSLAILAVLVIASASARAQVVPAVNGPKPLPISGTLKYDLRYSQTLQRYPGSGGTTQRSVVSGELTYSNSNAARPFSLTYSGGDMWNITGGSTGDGVFQHMAVSQGFVGRNWALNLGDDVSYLPQSPTSGFSGISGVGSLPTTPTQPTQPILTLNSRSVSNSFSSSFTHTINRAASLGISGNYGNLRFPNGDGLSMDQWQVGPEISWRLNALSSISAQYGYSRFSYPDYSFTMGTQSAQFGYQRTWSRRLKTNVSAGPEWIQGSHTLMIPSSTDLTMNANVLYEARSMSATLSYSQAATGGAGVTTDVGAHNRDIGLMLSRQFGRNLTANAYGSYMRTNGLQQNGVTNGKIGGAGATRQLGRFIIVFVNYTAIQQSSSAALPTNAISGLSQVVGFGIGYSPREMHFKK